MLRYICISFILWVPSLLCGQEESRFIEKWTVPQGFTIGVNLAGPFNSFMDSDRTGFSFLTRININEDLFFRGEAGYENVNFRKEKYHYDTNGTFIKAGLEMNMITKKEPGTNAQLLFGLHYGLALQEQSASQFMIDNGYWIDYTGRIGSHTVNSQWVELSGGPRIEIFTNFYVGWNIHIRVITLLDKPEMLKPYFIPGFGNGDNRLNAGFSYSLEYMIPWKQ